MSIIYYIDKIGWNTVVELADLGLLTWYEEALALISDVRHYVNIGQYTVAVTEISKLERALRLLLHVLFKYMVEHKRRPPEEYTELVKAITDKWIRLYKDFQNAVNTVVAKKLGIQQQFIGESYIGLYINRLIDFVETIACNINDPDKLRRELSVTTAVMPTHEGEIPTSELSELEEVAYEQQAQEQQQSHQELLSDDEIKVIRLVVNNGGKIPIANLTKRLKKTDEEIINLIMSINEKISSQFGIKDPLLSPIREDTTVLIAINKELAKTILDLIPKNSRLRRILKRIQ